MGSNRPYQEININVTNGSTTGARAATAEVPRYANHQSDIGVVAHMLDLAQDLAIEDIVAIDHAEHGAGYHINRRRVDQLTTLLIVVGELAERSAMTATEAQVRQSLERGAYDLVSEARKRVA